MIFYDILIYILSYFIILYGILSFKSTMLCSLNSTMFYMIFALQIDIMPWVSPVRQRPLSLHLKRSLHLACGLDPRLTLATDISPYLLKLAQTHGMIL
jgi:hypothetical protein